MDILEFYGLKEDPFGLTPDPAFFFPSIGHNEALQTMNYVVEQREGFCLVTGEPGTGKTTLLKVFKDYWKDKAEIAMILTPRLSPEEFLLSVLEDLNVELPSKGKTEILKAFRDFLIEKSQMKRPVLIIVDEAQNLPDETLEELRLLSNLETDKDKLLQIILIGQPELEKRLYKDNLRQLNQRITVRARLEPFSGNETFEYINYRLIKAGKGFLKLDDKLAKPIHRFSSGIPRLINILTSRAIMSAYLEGSNIVTIKHARYAIRHLKDHIPEKSHYVMRRMIYATIVLLLIAGTMGFYLLKTGYKTLYIEKEYGVVKKTPPQQPSQTVEDKKETGNLTEPIQKNMEEQKKQKRYAVVAVNSANLRIEPTLDSERVTWASKGVTLEIVDEFVETSGKKWYKVKVSDGRECWIADKVVAVKTVTDD
ncbi:MAG: AAA family ATPase [Thermodesulfovibrionales bacterium]